MTSSYQMDIKYSTLIFSTSSFKAEKGSLLYRGIYNREPSSSLVAGALVMLIGFFSSKDPSKADEIAIKFKNFIKG